MSAVSTTGARPLRWHSAPAAYALFAAAAAVLLAPSLLAPAMLHDSFGISWVWADQFTAELARGNLYPRWLPLSNSGLGSPVFYYYPPLAFYLTAALGLLGLSTYGTILAAFGASFALSGVTAWHWLKERSERPLLGALMFMAAPYHIFDFTRRGALAESLAIALIPLVAIGLRRVAEGRGFLLAALAYAAMILTHLPLALLTSVLLIVPSAASHLRKLPAFAAAVTLGIGLSAIYLLPALALDEFRDTAMLYRHDFLNPGYWSPWSADLSSGFVATVFAIVAALGVAALIVFAAGREPWAIGALLVVLLSAGLVPLFWHLPLLDKVQFPYRALPIAEFALITAIARTKLTPLAIAALVPLALLSAAFVSPGESDSTLTVAALEAGHPDVAEYLPPGAIARDDTRTRPRDLPAKLLPAPHVAGRVVDPVFYFPAWSCGEMHAPTKLLIRDPSCSPRIISTREERVGAALTALSLLVAAAAIFRLRRRTRARRKLLVA